MTDATMGCYILKISAGIVGYINGMETKVPTTENVDWFHIVFNIYETEIII